jgi:hypothetical protein
MIQKRVVSYVLLCTVLYAIPAPSAVCAQDRPGSGKINRGQFALSYDARGTTVSNPQDPYVAEFLTQGAHLGEPVVRYKVEGRDWLDLPTRERKLEADSEHGSLAYNSVVASLPIFE